MNTQVVTGNEDPQTELTSAEVVHLTRYDAKTVNSMCEDGRIRRAYKVGGDWRVALKDILNFLRPGCMTQAA